MAGAVADYEIEIPSSAMVVEVRVAGAQRFLKQGTRIVAGDAERAAGGSRFVIPFRP